MSRYTNVIIAAWLVGTGCMANQERTQAAEQTEGSAAPSIPAIRETTIGGGPGSPTELLRVVDATRLTGGAVVVVDQFRPGVLFFDSTGTFIRAVGRRGAGPGEFQSPGWLLRCSSDSVYVWDFRLGRVSVMDSSGHLIRDFRLTTSPYKMVCVQNGPIAVLDKPRFMDRMDPQGRALRRYVGTLWLADEMGRRTQVVGDMDLGENRPLGRLTKIALAADRIYVGTAELSLVDVYGFDGSTLAPIDVGVRSRAPTAADYDRAIAALVAGFSDRDYRERMRRELLKIPKPDLLPAYGDMFADPSGTLWVVTSGPADSVTVVRVIRRDGQVLGDVSLPEAAVILEVSGDHLLVLEEGRGGGQRVVLYSVRVPGML